MQSLIVGEYGVTVVANTGMDVSSYDLSLLVEKPNGTQVEWIADLDAADHTRMEYMIKSGDLDQAGVYVIHARAVIEGQQSRLGKAAAFEVKERFERSQ
jgi:hypothetical protein